MNSIDFWSHRSKVKVTMGIIDNCGVPGDATLCVVIFFTALLWSYVVRRPSFRPWSLTFHIFNISSETSERNSTKPDRKQDLNVLYKVCVFRADRENKMAALHSDWLRHFRLLLWNHWTEFNETLLEARSQCPLPSLCFSSWLEKQDGHPGLWLVETLLTSPLKLLNRIQLNLTGSKISTSSTKFVFFGRIGKTRWLPLPLIGWDIFNFYSEPPEWNSTKLDRKQDLNVLYQVCVFFVPIGKTRWPPWPLIGWDIFYFSSETAETEFNETWQEAISQRPLPILYFLGRSVNINGGKLYSGARYVALWASCFHYDVTVKALETLRSTANYLWGHYEKQQQSVWCP